MRKRDTTFYKDVVRRLQLCVFYLLFLSYTYKHPGASRSVFATNIYPGQDLPNRRFFDDVQAWTAAGRALIGLARRCGSYGILLALPSSIPRSVWETHLRKSSQRFEDAVEQLRTRGICEFTQEFDAFRAGDKIERALRLPPPEDADDVAFREMDEGS